MVTDSCPLVGLLRAYERGATDPVEQARKALSRANGNASRNTYIALSEEWTLAEAERAAQQAKGPLRGVPVALKDCFDLQGFATSSGSKFYAERGPVAQDSAVAARLRRSGAVIVGKAHLHQLAYGITGENRDYGDCLQPRDAARLTGGSSSGSAAAVQEGSALAAIGTDTGGSVRAPAALCGLAGYRSSLGIGDWRGGHHLAPAFDTIGWLFRDLRDAPLLAEALFDWSPGEPSHAPATETPRVGVLSGAFLHECDATVQRSLADWQERLSRLTVVETMEVPEFWFDAWDIYAPIQAAEAAQIHAGWYEHFEPAIAARLRWGAALSDDTISTFRLQHAAYWEQLQRLFARFDCVLAPATPVSRFNAGADHTESRARILRHTTPASLGGLPALVLPAEECGVQLMAAQGDDRRLLRLAAQLGELMAGEV